MASQRQLERLWKQVQRLHQRDEYWAATSRLARMWITPKHAPPYRPYVTLVLSQQGKIVSSHVLEQLMCQHFSGHRISLVFKACS